MITKIKRAIMHPSHLALFLLHKTAHLWPDKLYLKLKFRLVMGQKLDLKNPKTFNEKLQWLKLYNRRPEYTMMVDKYAVKQYVADKIGDEYIIPTLGVWDSVESIDWDSLPNQFVLKTTHGGGGCGVVICKDKPTFDIETAKQKLQKSLDSDIYLNFREWPYKDVPKRIIAEQYMADESGIELKDYKFFCFNGRVQCFKVDFDRFINHKANYYDREGTLLPFGEKVFPPDFDRVFDKPKNFDSMISLAERLSEDVSFVRVDFYNSNGHVYFGEITFFPAAGFGKFEPEEWDETLGEFLILPKNKVFCR